MAASGESRTATRVGEDVAPPIPSAGFAGPTVRFVPGTLLARRYRIISPLGQGGMGEVFRADDVRLGQAVALKFLPADLSADPGRLQRLVDEVRIGRQISHPNVCRLYDIAEAEGHHFLVMEYVDGEDLASLLRRIGRLPGNKAKDIARGICAGLAAAHDKGVIHRDLKPANVMIDGDGQARLADFGLAALAAEGALDEMSGTPQYMAPEQLMGGAASMRSDVYALGLVLLEILTGKRVFDTSSLSDLRLLHAQAHVPGLSAAVDVDPQLGRAIERCIEPDPNHRPASARSVLNLLPGGDALETALLAGETPSPAMVAAAGQVGNLTPRVAWLAMAGGLLVLSGLASMTRTSSLFGRVGPVKSPEVLGERAREVRERLGYPEEARDAAWGFEVAWPYLNAIERSDASAHRWDKLERLRPAPLRFYHRESPVPLVSSAWIGSLPWLGPPELGRITRDDPSLNIPGMTEVVLDAAGRLTSFAAVPARFEPTARPWPEPDWSRLLVEAELDPSHLTPVAPAWSAWTDSDRKAAWVGTYPGQPDTSVRVEAASFHGRPVYFEVRSDGGEPAFSEGRKPMVLRLALASVFLSVPPLLVALMVLVRRNLHLGRGDRRGASRLALFVLVALILAQGVRADHTSLGLPEYTLLLGIISQACFAALLAWSVYMALEPAMRRRWPRALISWSRLMTGRFADPLVGRDVLAGVIMGLVIALARFVWPVWLDQASSISVTTISSLSSPRHVAYFLLLGLCLGIMYSLTLLLSLLLLRTLVRREWLALALLFAFGFLIVLSLGEVSLTDVAFAGTFAGLVAFAMTRFGLLSSSALFFTVLAMVRTPLTLDPNAWYAGRSFAVLVLFSSILMGAAYVSLGGKPLFGKALIED